MKRKRSVASCQDDHTVNRVPRNQKAVEEKGCRVMQTGEEFWRSLFDSDDENDRLALKRHTQGREVEGKVDDTGDDYNEENRDRSVGRSDGRVEGSTVGVVETIVGSKRKKKKIKQEDGVLLLHDMKATSSSSLDFFPTVTKKSAEVKSVPTKINKSERRMFLVSTSSSDSKSEYIFSRFFFSVLKYTSGIRKVALLWLPPPLKS